MALSDEEIGLTPKPQNPPKPLTFTDEELFGDDGKGPFTLSDADLFGPDATQVDPELAPHQTGTLPSRAPSLPSRPRVTGYWDAIGDALYRGYHGETEADLAGELGNLVEQFNRISELPKGSIVGGPPQSSAPIIMGGMGGSFGTGLNARSKTREEVLAELEAKMRMKAAEFTEVSRGLARSQGTTEGMQKFQEAEGFVDGLGALISNPLDVLGEGFAGSAWGTAKGIGAAAAASGAVALTGGAATPALLAGLGAQGLSAGIDSYDAVLLERLKKIAADQGVDISQDPLRWIQLAKNNADFDRLWEQSQKDAARVGGAEGTAVAVLGGLTRLIPGGKGIAGKIAAKAGGGMAEETGTLLASDAASGELSSAKEYLLTGGLGLFMEPAADGAIAGIGMGVNKAGQSLGIIPQSVSPDDIAAALAEIEKIEQERAAREAAEAAQVPPTQEAAAVPIPVQPPVAPQGTGLTDEEIGIAGETVSPEPAVEPAAPPADAEAPPVDRATAQEQAPAPQDTAPPETTAQPAPQPQAQPSSASQGPQAQAETAPAPQAQGELSREAQINVANGLPADFQPPSLGENETGTKRLERELAARKDQLAKALKSGALPTNQLNAIRRSIKDLESKIKARSKDVALYNRLTNYGRRRLAMPKPAPAAEASPPPAQATAAPQAQVEPAQQASPAVESGTVDVDKNRDLRERVGAARAAYESSRASMNSVETFERTYELYDEWKRLRGELDAAESQQAQAPAPATATQPTQPAAGAQEGAQDTAPTPRTEEEAEREVQSGVSISEADVEQMLSDAADAEMDAEEDADQQELENKRTKPGVSQAKPTSKGGIAPEREQEATAIAAKIFAGQDTSGDDQALVARVRELVEEGKARAGNSAKQGAKEKGTKWEIGNKLSTANAASPSGVLDTDTVEGRIVMSAAMAYEVQYHSSEGKTDVNADWYSASVERAVRIANKLLNGALDDPGNDAVFRFIFSITSNGQAVEDNAKIGTFLMRRFLETGRFSNDFKGGGARRNMMIQHFQLADNILAALGGDKNLFREFLNTKFTPDELFAKLEQLGFIKDEKSRKKWWNVKLTIKRELGSAYGSHLFGFKLGGEFYQNMRGNKAQTTKDTWFARAFYRIKGDLTETSPKAIVNAINRLMEGAVSEGYPIPRKVLADAKRHLKLLESGKADKTVPIDPNGPLWAFAKARLSAYNRSGYKDKTEVNRSSKSIVENTRSFEETVRPGDRAVMDTVSAMARQMLASSGINLTPDAFQAEWWGSEKALYDHLGQSGALNENETFDLAMEQVYREDTGNEYEDPPEFRDTGPRRANAGDAGTAGQGDAGDVQGEASEGDADPAEGDADPEQVRSAPGLFGTPEQIAELQAKADELDRRRAARAAAQDRNIDPATRRRGPEAVVQRLVNELRRGGKLTATQVMAMLRPIETLIENGYLDNLAASVSTSTQVSGTRGAYSPITNLVMLFLPNIADRGDGTFLRRTFTHEIAHHLERMLPERFIRALRQDLQRARAKWLKDKPGFAKLLGNGDWTDVSIPMSEVMAMLERGELVGTDPEAKRKFLKQLNDYFGWDTKKGNIRLAWTDESYRFANTSEWLAENIAEIAAERDDARVNVQGKISIWRSISDFLTAMYEAVVKAFGGMVVEDIWDRFQAGEMPTEFQRESMARAGDQKMERNRAGLFDESDPENYFKPKREVPQEEAVEPVRWWTDVGHNDEGDSTKQYLWAMDRSMKMHVISVDELEGKMSGRETESTYGNVTHLDWEGLGGTDGVPHNLLNGPAHGRIDATGTPVKVSMVGKIKGDKAFQARVKAELADVMGEDVSALRGYDFTDIGFKEPPAIFDRRTKAGLGIKTPAGEMANHGDKDLASRGFVSKFASANAEKLKDATITIGRDRQSDSSDYKYFTISMSDADGQRMGAVDFRVPADGFVENGETIGPVKQAYAYVVSADVRGQYQGKGLSKVIYAELGERLRRAGVADLEGTVVDDKRRPIAARIAVFGNVEITDDADYAEDGGTRLEINTRIDPNRMLDQRTQAGLGMDGDKPNHDNAELAKRGFITKYAAGNAGKIPRSVKVSFTVNDSNYTKGMKRGSVVLLGGKSGQEEVGMIAFTIDPRGYAEIDQSFVEPGYRGKGIGKIMYAEVGERLRRMGQTEVYGRIADKKNRPYAIRELIYGNVEHIKFDSDSNEVVLSKLDPNTPLDQRTRPGLGMEEPNHGDEGLAARGFITNKAAELLPPDYRAGARIRGGFNQFGDIAMTLTDPDRQDVGAIKVYIEDGEATVNRIDVDPSARRLNLSTVLYAEVGERLRRKGITVLDGKMIDQEQRPLAARRRAFGDDSTEVTDEDRFTAEQTGSDPEIHRYIRTKIDPDKLLDQRTKPGLGLPPGTLDQPAAKGDMSSTKNIFKRTEPGSFAFDLQENTVALRLEDGTIRFAAFWPVDSEKKFYNMLGLDWANMKFRELDLDTLKEIVGEDYVDVKLNEGGSSAIITLQPPAENVLQENASRSLVRALQAMRSKDVKQVKIRALGFVNSNVVVDAVQSTNTNLEYRFASVRDIRDLGLSDEMAWDITLSLEPGEGAAGMGVDEARKYIQTLGTGRSRFGLENAQGENYFPGRKPNPNTMQVRREGENYFSRIQLLKDGQRIGNDGRLVRGYGEAPEYYDIGHDWPEWEHPEYGNSFGVPINLYKVSPSGKLRIADDMFSVHIAELPGDFSFMGRVEHPVYDRATGKILRRGRISMHVKERGAPDMDDVRRIKKDLSDLAIQEWNIHEKTNREYPAFRSATEKSDVYRAALNNAKPEDYDVFYFALPQGMKPDYGLSIEDTGPLVLDRRTKAGLGLKADPVVTSGDGVTSAADDVYPVDVKSTSLRGGDGKGGFAPYLGSGLDENDPQYNPVNRLERGSKERIRQIRKWVKNSAIKQRVYRGQGGAYETFDPDYSLDKDQDGLMHLTFNSDYAADYVDNKDADWQYADGSTKPGTQDAVVSGFLNVKNVVDFDDLGALVTAENLDQFVERLHSALVSFNPKMSEEGKAELRRDLRAELGGLISDDEIPTMPIWEYFRHDLWTTMFEDMGLDAIVYRDTGNNYYSVDASPGDPGFEQMGVKSIAILDPSKFKSTFGSNDVNPDSDNMFLDQRTAAGLGMDKLVEEARKASGERDVLGALDNWAGTLLADARKRMNSPTPDVLAALAWETARAIGRNATTFAKWSAQQIKDFGPQLKPRLKSLWATAKRIAGNLSLFPPYRYFMGVSSRAWDNVGRFPQSKTLRQLAELIANRLGPDSTAEETDIPNRIKLAHVQYENIWSKILERFSLEFSRMNKQERRDWDMAFRRHVIEGTVPSDPKLAQAVADYRRLMKALRDYQVAAGITLGDQGENYMPRRYDSAAIEDDPAGFVKAAMQAYRARDVRLGNPIKSPDEYRDMAEAWMNNILTGKIDDISLFGGNRSKSNADSTDPRTFEQSEADFLDAFIVADMDQLTIGYIQAAVRFAEVVRAFGEDGSRFSSMMNKLATEGVDARAIEEMDRLVRKAVGIGRERLSGGASYLMDWSALVIATAYLGKSAMYNLLLEPISFGNRAMTPLAGIKGVLMTWANLANELMKADPAVRQAIEAKYGNQRAWQDSVERAFAEQLGLISHEIERQYVSSHWNYTDEDVGGSQLARWLTRRVYRANLMAASERAKIEASVNIARMALRDNVRFMFNQHPVQKLFADIGIDASAPKSSAVVLREAGIPDAQHQAFGQWVLALEGLDDKAWYAKVMGSDPEAKLYRRAVQRMSLGMSIKPDAAMRMASADRIEGRLLMSLMNYTYTYFAMVTGRLYRMTKEAFAKGDQTVMDRARYLAPLVAAIMTVAAAEGTRRVAGVLYESEGTRRRAESSLFAKVFDSASFAGLFPPQVEIANKVIQRRQIPGGPVLETAAKTAAAVGNLAINPSEAGGQGVAKQAYKVVAQPAIVAGASAAHPFLGFVANQAAMQEETQEAFIEATTGQKVERKK